jgi:hypothetical protein
MAVGPGFSYLFWNESVRPFHGCDYWVNTFTSRGGFDLWQAFFVPIVFFFDLLRKCFQFCWQVPNIFSIGVSA